jgi:hypothetical protein
LLDHPWILRRSSPPEVAILYEKASVEAVAIAIAVAIAFAIAAGFRPRHGGRGGELIVREKVDLSVLQPVVGVLLGGRRRTAAISAAARAMRSSLESSWQAQPVPLVAAGNCCTNGSAVCAASESQASAVAQMVDMIS